MKTTFFKQNCKSIRNYYSHNAPTHIESGVAVLLFSLALFQPTFLYLENLFYKLA